MLLSHFKTVNAIFYLNIPFFSGNVPAKEQEQERVALKNADGAGN